MTEQTSTSSTQILKEKLWDLLQPIVKHHCLELFEIKIQKRSRGFAIAVVIDNPCGDVTISDCEKINRHLELVLDGSGLVGQRYSLEVGSPGMDRPLRSLADVHRFEGKLAKVIFSPSVTPQTAIGKILPVEGDFVSIQLEEGGVVKAPWDEVVRANLEVELFRHKRACDRKKSGKKRRHE